MFKFCFGRSSCTSKITLSPDKKCYVICSRKWKKMYVPLSQLQLEVNRKIGKHSGTVLVDTGICSLSKEFSGPVIMVARFESLIEKFFEQNNLPYPGLTEKKSKKGNRKNAM